MTMALSARSQRGASPTPDPRVACPVCGGLVHPVAGKCKHCKTDLVKLGDCGARTVAELMTTTTYSLQESTSIADAIATMGFEGIHHAPVVNDDGTVTGMLSSVDLLRWIAQREGYKPAASGTRRAFDHG